MTRCRKTQEARHFLEKEIEITKDRLKDSSNYYNGEYVGNKIATRLKEKHILFCNNVLSLFCGEKDSKCDFCDKKDNEIEAGDRSIL